jgi:hypothetical protein
MVGVNKVTSVKLPRLDRDFNLELATYATSVLTTTLHNIFGLSAHRCKTDVFGMQCVCVSLCIPLIS